MIFLTKCLLEMVISLDLHPMTTLVVVNQGHPNIMECPPELDLGAMIKKSIGHSQEYRETITSSKIPTGLTSGLFANSRTLVVGLRFGNCNISIFIVVVIFITATW